MSTSDATPPPTAPSRPARRRTPAHPLLEALLHDEHGDRRPRYPDHELPARTAWERVYGVVPLLIRKGTGLLKSIPRRDRASGFELEDVVLIMVMDLVKHDHLWDRARGAYTTFAGMRADNQCVSMRGKARVVESIRGNAQKLQVIREAKEENRDTSRMRVSEANLHVASAPIEPISEAGGLEWDSDMLAELEEEERLADCRRRALALASGLPDPTMAFIVSLFLGAGRREPMNTREVADRVGLSMAKVASIRHKAESLLRQRAGV